MKKGINVFTMVVVIIFCICKNNYGQRTDTLRIKFIEDGVIKKINDSDKFLFINTNDTLQTKIDSNHFLSLPDHLKYETYDVIFIHDTIKLLFTGIDKHMLKPNGPYEWKLGIDNRPFDNLLGLLSYNDFLTDSTTKKLIYWQFSPLDDGDGIQIVHKIK